MIVKVSYNSINGIAQSEQQHCDNENWFSGIHRGKKVCKTKPIEIAESKHTNAVRLLLNTSLPFKFAKHRKAISTENPMVANTNKTLFTSFLKKGFIINKVLRLKIEIEVS